MVKGYKYDQSLCVFLDDVVCPSPKSVNKRERFSSGFIATHCSKCSHHKSFVLMMDAKDEEMMDAIDRERERLDGVC